LNLKRRLSIARNYYFEWRSKATVILCFLCYDFYVTIPASRQPQKINIFRWGYPDAQNRTSTYAYNFSGYFPCPMIHEGANGRGTGGKFDMTGSDNPAKQRNSTGGMDCLGS